ncbi:MAG: ABC transporter permease subunit [bacterium]|nr:ABC transporter permease subunit [bacterium]
MIAITKRELAIYFVSPIAYIIITIFLLVTGFFFFQGFFFFHGFFFLGRAEMRSLFELFPAMFTLVIPALTMRLFAEEQQSGTIEILMTLPVKTIDVVLGKLMGTTLFIAVMISPTIVYFFVVLALGSPDVGPVIGGYLGTLLLGGAYASIGMLASALTRNQIVAFLIALGMTFHLWVIDKLTMVLPTGLTGFFQNLGTVYHFDNIAKGLINSRDVIYFISIMVVSVLITTKILAGRK